MRKIFELYAPCHFGLEAVLKKEIIDIGYDITKVEDGRVYFEGDDEAVARANMWLRTTERVMINVAQFRATSFSELFDSVADIPWEEYIPVGREVLGQQKPPQSKANSSHLQISSPS